MVHGYKGFNTDMTCRGFQYEAGKVYEMDGEIEPCERGFHFCRNAADVLNYYGGEDCRYVEVEALGKVIDDGNKSVTNMYVQEGLDFKDVGVFCYKTKEMSYVFQ